MDVSQKICHNNWINYTVAHRAVTKQSLDFGWSLYSEVSYNNFCITFPIKIHPDITSSIERVWTTVPKSIVKLLNPWDLHGEPRDAAEGIGRFPGSTGCCLMPVSPPASVSSWVQENQMANNAGKWHLFFPRPQELLQFPKSTCVLWDGTSTGPPAFLHVAQNRSVISCCS